LPQQKISYRIPKKARVIIWLNGLFAFTIPFSLLFWGEKSVSAGLAGVLNGTVPLWAFVLGAIFTPGREPIVFKKVSGLILGLVGVISIFLPKLMGDHGAENGGDPSLWGGFAITMMAISYATSSLINREIFSNYKQMHPFTNLFHQLVAGLVGLIILACLLEGIPDVTLWRPYSTVMATSLYLGVFSTCIAFMCFYHLIKEWGPIQATTVTYLVPAITLLFDVLLNHSVLKINEILGLILVTLGVIILNLQIPKMRKKIKKNNLK
jgi:drug/metabolite transporter (DMT)-like permease